MCLTLELCCSAGKRPSALPVRLPFSPACCVGSHVSYTRAVLFCREAALCAASAAPILTSLLPRRPKAEKYPFVFDLAAEARSSSAFVGGRKVRETNTHVVCCPSINISHLQFFITI